MPGILKPSVTVTVPKTISKKQKKETKEYLENIDAKKVEMVYGVGHYTPRHGDGKSQSKTNVTFQTKSIQTSGNPKEYVTIVAVKKKSEPFVEYRSTNWDKEPAKVVIDAMIKGLSSE